MCSTLGRTAAALMTLALVGCTPAASQSPSATQVPTGSAAITGATASPSATAIPLPTASPSEGAPGSSSPSLPPPVASIGIPVHDSAREISSHDILMAPRRDGSLYVLIPSRNDATQLALLDPSGRVASGWPVRLDDVDFCDQVLAVDDGSVRVICTRPNPGNVDSVLAAFAFGADGRSLDGWPVERKATFVNGRVIGDALTLVAVSLVGEQVEDGQLAEVAIVTIGRDGATTTGAPMPIGQVCCGTTWLMGPDGIGYGVTWPDGQTRSTRLSAIGPTGPVDGWPVSISGVGLQPAFGPGGRIVMAVGSTTSGTTRVVVVDRGGSKTPSDRLPIRIVEDSGDMGCTIGAPRSPLAATDGTTFVYSELDRSIYAVDKSLQVKSGWPMTPAAPLEVARPGLESEHEAGYCPTPVVPGIGPDSTMYLALTARSGSVGGSLTAIGPNGRVRSGWPVTLDRAGSEFWSVVVGSDGTAYALAIEPESGGTSSASIVAIAPDSTVRWTTTIIDP